MCLPLKFSKTIQKKKGVFPIFYHFTYAAILGQKYVAKQENQTIPDPPILPIGVSTE
jgi:hypothetical protein